jgi:small-conductance mechanosensitive channel
MEEKEKYKAEIEARLRKFSDTLNEIRAKLKERKEMPPDFQIEPILEKQKKVTSKANEIEKTDESAWSKFKSELDDLVNDIDHDMRKAMAYFK